MAEKTQAERFREMEEAAARGFTDRTESGGIGLKRDGTLNIGPRPGVPPPKLPLTIIMPDGEIISDLARSIVIDPCG